MSTAKSSLTSLTDSDNKVAEVEELFAEPHPLLNDVVLKEVFKYLDSPSSKPSLITLKNARSVCQKWNESISQRFFARSTIMKQSHARLNSLLKIFPITMTETPDPAPSVSTPIAKITSLKISPQWFEKEKFREWLEFHGPKLRRVTLTGKIDFDRDLISLLFKWCTNLEELILDDVTASQDLVGLGQQHQFSEKCFPNILRIMEESPKCNLKHLTVLTLNSSNKYMESVAIAVILVAFHVKNLESLTLHCPWSDSILDVPHPHPTVLQIMESDLFDQFIEQMFQSILNSLRLREIRVYMTNDIPFVSDLKYFAETLVNFHLHVEDGKRVNNAELIFPQLVKMEELVYSYSSALGCFNQGDGGSAGNEDFGEDANHGEEIQAGQALISSKMIINSMAGLRSWIVKQCDARWMSKGHVSNCYFTNRSCASGRCSHVKELLVRMEVVVDQVALSITHESLEKLEFSCCFREPEMILNLSSVFVNLKDLSIWIRSTELHAFIANLVCLENLERFKVQLSMNVQDFSIAINSNLSLFKSLKELCFEKCNGLRDRKAIHHIARVDEAHTGFSECKTLEILSFKSIKIDVQELNILREALLKSKPNLAVNAEHCY